ncbi:UvrB/UvrC motif-containing protein [Terrisporobacter sp.]|uniref:UvrB/UvrC motif-containing protein n=1 Tax=Terrisporobacter sp. TaxID=1965305 RepID=UPI00262703B7|nr:UvrB/UvrC motif-containing protein [Terrisporobacter sp.]
MLCQVCHKKTAAVFISSIINGQETRLYLCNDCAKDYPLFNLNLDESFSIKDLMDKLQLEEQFKSEEISRKENKQMSLEKNNTYKNIICPECCSTYDEYRTTGKLGCSGCYEAFEDQLELILKKLYGYSDYVGKIPKSDNTHIYIRNEIRILKEDLNRAVEREEYEKAADIRDKIRELQECNE